MVFHSDIIKLPWDHLLDENRPSYINNKLESVEKENLSLFYNSVTVYIF